MYEETKLAVAGFIQNKSFKKEREGKKISKTEPNRHAKTNKVVSFAAKTGKDPPRRETEPPQPPRRSPPPPPPPAKNS
jgi:hypothetical protein